MKTRIQYPLDSKQKSLDGRLHDVDIYSLTEYNINGEVEWAKSLGGTNREYIYSLAATENGGCIAGGCFNSSSIQLGDYIITKSNANQFSDAFLVKYNVNGEVEWASSFGGNDYEYLQSIAVTEDGGYIVVGYFYSSSMQVGNYRLTRNGSGYDAFLVKYNRNNEVEWVF